MIKRLGAIGEELGGAVLNSVGLAEEIELVIFILAVYLDVVTELFDHVVQLGLSQVETFDPMFELSDGLVLFSFVEMIVVNLPHPV